MQPAILLYRFGVMAVVMASGAARASETITYSYDAHGRLVQAQHSGSVNNGVATAYTFDRAHNCTAKMTTGAP